MSADVVGILIAMIAGFIGYKYFEELKRRREIRELVYKLKIDKRKKAQELIKELHEGVKKARETHNENIKKYRDKYTNNVPSDSNNSKGD